MRRFSSPKIPKTAEFLHCLFSNCANESESPGLVWHEEVSSPQIPKTVEFSQSYSSLAIGLLYREG
jgi:hypothetical protein